MKLAIKLLLATILLEVISSAVHHRRHKIRRQGPANWLKKNTGTNDDGDGSIFYLDRHNVACPAGSAILGFHLFRPSGGKIYYEFDCTASKAITNDVITQTTDFTNTDSQEKASMNYLDRHRVQCPDGRALQSFKINRNPSNTSQIQYAYNCAKINSNKCVRTELDWTSMGNKSIFYLDRQYISPAQGGYVLQGFKLNTSYSYWFGDKISYEINSCNLVEPQEAPISTPTPHPDSNHQSNQTLKCEKERWAKFIEHNRRRRMRRRF